MADSTVDGNTRVITTVTGLAMPEEIITNDSIQRRFQYRVTSPIFTSHLGTIDVFDLENGRSLVSYSTDAEPDALALMIGGALHELRRLLQDGSAHPSPDLSTQIAAIYPRIRALKNECFCRPTRVGIWTSHRNAGYPQP